MLKKHSHSLDYYTYISGMRNWNSFYKVLFSFSSLLWVIIADSSLISLWTILFMSVLILKVGKIGFHDYVGVLKIPIVFIIMSSIAIMTTVDPNLENAWYIDGKCLGFQFFSYYVYLTKAQCMLSCKVAAKAIGAICAMYMMTLSTPMGEVLAVFRKLHAPKIIVELMHLIYRYIFMMSDVYQMQKDATTSRLGYINFRTSVRSFSNNVANLLVMSLARANTCYDAMESRGYDGEFCVMEERRKIGAGQIGIMLIYFVVTIGLTVFVSFRKTI